jgi:transcriptional regulator with XRE-family HTH domain
MGVSQKRIGAIEENEIKDRIEIATLIKVAEIFDSELRYFFVPRKPLEDIRKSVIHKSYQQKYTHEELALLATTNKLRRLHLRSVYGQDPTLF